jgi:hypothetical protein
VTFSFADKVVEEIDAVGIEGKDPVVDDERLEVDIQSQVKTEQVLEVSKR